MNNEEKTPVSKGTQQTVPPYAYYPQPQNDELNLIDYWRILVERKWFIILVTLFFTFISIAVALLTTPIYRAEVLLAPVVEEGGGANALGQFGGLASMAGIDVGGNESVDHSLAVLTSRHFIEKFFKEKKLLPILFSDKWDEITERWLVEDEDDIPTIWKAYEVFSQEILNSSIDKKSGLVTVSIEWKDPEIAAQWVNDLIFRLNKQLRTLAINEAESSIDYLQSQLQQTSVVDMHQVLYRLIESETKKIMLAKVRDQYAFKVIDPAVVPEEKIKPKRALIVVFGVVAGLIFSIFLSLLFKAIARQHEANRSQKI